MSHHPIRTTSLALTAVLMLGLGATAPANAASKSFTVTMTGAGEAPAAGDMAGTGTATVTVDDESGMVCYDLTTSLTDAVAAHIHKGAKGAAGGVAVPLEAPKGGAAKACAKVDKAVASAILADPAGYYVNVHTPKFPAGAIRAQLGG